MGTFNFYKEMKAMAESAFPGQEVRVEAQMVGDNYKITVDGETVHDGPYEGAKLFLEDKLDLNEIESKLNSNKSDDEIISEMSEIDDDDIILSNLDDKQIQALSDINDVLNNYTDKLNELYDELEQEIEVDMGKLSGDIVKKLNNAIGNYKWSTAQYLINDILIKQEKK